MSRLISQSNFFAQVQGATPYDKSQRDELAQVLTTPVVLSALREILLHSDNILAMIKTVSLSDSHSLIKVAEYKTKAVAFEEAIALLYDLTEDTEEQTTETSATMETPNE